MLIGEKDRSKKDERGIVFLERSLYQTLSCTPPTFALPNIGPVKWVLLLGYAGRLENGKDALLMRGPILRGFCVLKRLDSLKAEEACGRATKTNRGGHDGLALLFDLLS